MFVEACAKSIKYTKPMVISTVRVDGTVVSGFGTYVFINREGWAMTAGHCVSCVVEQRAAGDKMREVDAWNNEHPDEKKEYDPKWLKTHSIWWGEDHIRIEKAHVMPDLDLALVKLVGIPDNFVNEFPTFKSPENIKQGMSLCRIGFPFLTIKSSFEPEHNRFRLDELPKDLMHQYFPNEGILTRNIVRRVKKPDGTLADIGPHGIMPLFIETSTPGLRGQSGGPIFDVKGNIVGLQSQTMHLDLGFGDRQAYGKYMPEQFMNVGLGVHATTLTKAMDKFGVKYKSESDDDGYRIIG